MNIIIIGDPTNVRELAMAMYAVTHNEIIGVNLRDVEPKLPEITTCEFISGTDLAGELLTLEKIAPPPKRNKKGKTAKNWQKKHFYD